MQDELIFFQPGPLEMTADLDYIIDTCITHYITYPIRIIAPKDFKVKNITYRDVPVTRGDADNFYTVILVDDEKLHSV